MRRKRVREEGVILSNSICFAIFFNENGDFVIRTSVYGPFANPSTS